MILDTNLKLEAVLGGAVSANQPAAHIHYVDWNRDGVPSAPATFRVALNGASDVTILAAPGINGPRREVIRASIYNRDTANVTVTVKTDDGTTEHIVAQTILATLETLHFEKGRGWYATTTAGAIK